MAKRSARKPDSGRSPKQFLAKLRTGLQGECDFSDAGVAMYTSDASNYRQIPLGVVYPAGEADLVLVNDLCREFRLPLLMRGAGTSQNGQCVNAAVVVDCSRHMNRVLSLDTESASAWVEPGIVCDSLKQAAEVHGMTFGPDPATHSRCTLGGMIGNNSCGPRSMLAGKTVENVLALDILTPGGERLIVSKTTDAEYRQIVEEGGARAKIYEKLRAISDEYGDDIRARFPVIKRRVSGYNLDQLLPENGFDVARALVGSEGTCVIILRAQVRLIRNPVYRQLIVLGFEDIYIAGDSVPEIMPFGPIAMEGLDQTIIGGLRARHLATREIGLLPAGQAWLMVELSADSPDELRGHVDAFTAAMRRSPRVRSVHICSSDEAGMFWSIREQGASATAMSLDPGEPDPVIGWEDTAVDPMRLGDYLRDFQALVDKYHYKTSLYGHFGDGCIHARITFDTRSRQGVADWRAFSEEIAALVVSYGGSLSGEHGDGQAKAEFLPLMFGERLMGAFEYFKKAFDPGNQMNPGKLINAYRMDQNLRYGPDYQTPVAQTALAFVEEPAGFGRVTERCIGMGKCRALTGPMCPSYQVTGMESRSPRGRAHLLHELLRGEILRAGWDDKEIASALDQCLSCKACRTECPTQVDIAAFKTEFLYQHYKNRRRPLPEWLYAHLAGWLPYLAPVAGIVNLLQRGPGAVIARGLLGIGQDKPLPKLARRSFEKWLDARQVVDENSFRWSGSAQDPELVLWADTFNNHYHPAVLQSAWRVLNRLGYRVGVAERRFCCGRPLLEHGYVEEARQNIIRILDDFHRHLPIATAVVVLEPSCLSMFTDDIGRLFPDDSRVADMAQRFVSFEALMSRDLLTINSRLPEAIVHHHCHMKNRSDQQGAIAWLDHRVENPVRPEAGCCGMAGSFGMKRRNRGISKALFNRNLKPAIDAGSDDMPIIANGFSCREQMSNMAGKEALHPVQVIEQLLDQDKAGV